MNIVGETEEMKYFLREWFNDLPYITAHTSGSTGEPKEIRLLKTDMMLSAKATCSYFNITDRSVLFLPLSVAYIAGKMMVVRSLVSGARLYVEHPSNHPMSADYGDVTLMAVVPSQLPSVLCNSRRHGIRNIIVGGAPMSAALERDVQGLSAHVYATYGMTETCSHVALRDVSEGSDVYHALPHIRFAVDGRNCLTIRCDNMGMELLQTNDVVDLLSETSFRWIGRYDNVINSGGIKLHPEILEKKLGDVLDCPFYFAGRPSERWGQELVLVTECSDTCKIMDKMSKVLNPYEMPKEIFCVRELPKTSNGKIRRIVPPRR